MNVWQEFWEIPRVFASQPLPRGNRIGIVTASGGAGVLAIDAAAAAGLEVATFTEATLEKLANLTPRMARNPVDLGPLMTISANPFSVPEQVLAQLEPDAPEDEAEPEDQPDEIQKSAPEPQPDEVQPAAAPVDASDIEIRRRRAILARLKSAA